MIVTITFILFVVCLLFFGSIPFISGYSRRSKEKICRQLSKSGAENGLIFCSQEILSNKVIGIDGIHRKIMIVENDKRTYHTSIIDLDEVQQCQLVSGDSAVGSDNALDGSKKIKEGALELRFQCNNPQQNTSISFSNGITQSKRELALLKAKAEYWSVMFSKMLAARVSVRA